MVKEKDILIRVGETLKGKVKEKADSMGLSLSSYIRTLIIKDLKGGK